MCKHYLLILQKINVRQGEESEKEREREDLIEASYNTLQEEIFAIVHVVA
jgi:hypothetical protein